MHSCNDHRAANGEIAMPRPPPIGRNEQLPGIVTWSPTIDPEALKTLSMKMAVEAKVRLLLRAWCTAPIVENGVVQGAIFESKEGRHAVLAKIVVDTTGDADLIARSGAPCRSPISTPAIFTTV